MKNNRSCGRGQPSTVENPLWRVGVLKNTKQKKLHIHTKYPARKLIELTASRHLKLSTHAGEIETKLNSTMHSTNPNQA